MENLDQKEIVELIETLPTQIQEVIKNSGWALKLSAIAKRHNLMLDQMTLLEHLVLLIMIGVINPNEISKELSEIGIKKDQINSIISEIDQEIFHKIKEVLIDNFEKIENTSSIKNPLERDSILREIEDKDETELLIPSVPQTPSTQVNTQEQNQKIISQDFSKQNQNTVAQKLQTPTVSAPKTMKIDPYREIPE